MADNVEAVLDELAVQIRTLEVTRSKVDDEVDRSAINSQILALGKLWFKLDNEDTSRSTDEVKDAIKHLGVVSKELKKQKQRLTDVAKVIHQAARAIALANKAWQSLT